MDKPIMRYFIPCESIAYSDDNKFSANGIYEFFSAKSYPAKIQFTNVLGISNLEVGREYIIKIVVSQRTGGDESTRTVIGGWLTDPFSLDNPDEIMNLRLEQAPVTILKEGPVTFEIFLDGELFTTQIIYARKEV